MPLIKTHDHELFAHKKNITIIRFGLTQVNETLKKHLCYRD
ncbi:hypothetical protein BLGI_4826 [Brevibacillus laterosporus GI-9]|nr:hypothetical protein BLGI_4826 [Brevibacillus laterosporus GI-9]